MHTVINVQQYLYNKYIEQVMYIIINSIIHDRNTLYNTLLLLFAGVVQLFLQCGCSGRRDWGIYKLGTFVVILWL